MEKIAHIPNGCHLPVFGFASYSKSAQADNQANKTNLPDEILAKRDDPNGWGNRLVLVYNIERCLTYLPLVGIIVGVVHLAQSLMDQNRDYKKISRAVVECCNLGISLLSIDILATLYQIIAEENALKEGWRISGVPKADVELLFEPDYSSIAEKNALKEGWRISGLPKADVELLFGSD